DRRQLRALHPAPRRARRRCPTCHCEPQLAQPGVRHHVRGRAASRRAGARALEPQLLAGMAEPVHAALTEMGRRVRVYAPIGELVPGMAYLVRRLLENTPNESLGRPRFAEGRNLDELVVPPAVDESTLPDATPEYPIRPRTDPAARATV